MGLYCLKINPFLILIVLCFASCNQEPSFNLSTIYDVSLPAGKRINWTLQLPSGMPSQQNLFISAYSLINDPFQEPILKIYCDNYTNLCDADFSDLDDFCFLSAEHVGKSGKVIIEAYCEVDCQARVLAYLSQTLTVGLGESWSMTSQDAPVEKSFMIAIPLQIQYSEIRLQAKATNDKNIPQEVQFYVNFGENPMIPTKADHSNIQAMNVGDGKLMMIRRNKRLKPGDYIAVMLALSANSKAIFSTIYKVGYDYHLTINQPFSDYIQGPDSSKNYSLPIKELQLRGSSLYLQIFFFTGTASLHILSQAGQEPQTLHTHDPSLIFQLPAAVLKDDTLRIRISSSQGASYQLTALLQAQNSVYQKERQMTYYVDIEPGEELEQLTFTSEDAPSSVLTQEFVFEELSGKYASVRVFACDSFTELGLCKVGKAGENLSHLKEVRIEKLTNSYSYNLNKSDCRELPHSISCLHVIVITSHNTSASGRYSFKFINRESTHLLQQGYQQYSTVQKDHYRFYQLHIPSNLTTYRGLLLSLSALQGKCTILASQALTRPTVDNINQVDSSSSSSLRLSALKPGKNLYISIFGEEHSTFTLVAIFMRSTSASYSFNVNPELRSQALIEISPIMLSKSVWQKYRLEKGMKELRFVIKMGEGEKGRLKVSRLVGKTETRIELAGSGEGVIVHGECILPKQGDEGGQERSYLVVVEGDLNEAQEFMIIFADMSASSCSWYPSNTPIFEKIYPHQSTCLKVPIDTTFDLELIISPTGLDLIDHSFLATVKLPLQPAPTPLHSNLMLFGSDTLKKYCPPRECQMILEFSSEEEELVNLQALVQRVDKIITLYDGIVQTVRSLPEGRSFKYHLGMENHNLEVIVRSEGSLGSYSIYASLMSEFQANNLQEVSVDEKIARWSMVRDGDSPSLSILKISSMEIYLAKKSLKLLEGISCLIFTVSCGQMDLRAFSVQVTEKERVIREGSSMVGYLQPNQIVDFELYPSQSSLLTVRPLNLITTPQGYSIKCYSVLNESEKVVGDLTDTDQLLIQQNSFDPSEPVHYKLSSNSKTESCMYQISLQHSQRSVISILDSIPEKISLKFDEITYFLYRAHQRHSRFRVLHTLIYGSSHLYLTKLPKENQTLLRQERLETQLPLQDFSYHKLEGKQKEIIVEADSREEEGQLYLIAVQGSPEALGEIVVLQEGVPIILTDNQNLHQRLEKGEWEEYIFYVEDGEQMNLVIDLNYGEVEVKISGQEQILVVEELKSSGERVHGVFPVAGSAQTNKYQHTLKKINVSIRSTSSQFADFYVKVANSLSQLKIYENRQMDFIVPSSGMAQLYLDNILEKNGALICYITFPQAQHLRHVSVDIVRYTLTANGVGVTAEGINKKQWVSVTDKWIKVTIQSTAISHYIITVKSSLKQDLKASVFMPITGLVVLESNRKLYVDGEKVFKIFVPPFRDLLIEATSCIGDLRIRGSRDYQEIRSPTYGRDEVQLLHQNLAGHYVIRTENVSGIYYVRVQSKQYFTHMDSNLKSISYVIKCRTLLSSNPNYYDLFDISDNAIVFENENDVSSVHISLEKVREISDGKARGFQVDSINYVLTIGLSQKEVRLEEFCPVTQKLRYLNLQPVAPERLKKRADPNRINFLIPKKKIVSKIGERSAFVGATAYIKMYNPSTLQTVDSIVYLYEPVAMPKYQVKRMMTTLGFLEIAVTICLGVAGLIVGFVLFRRSITIYRGYQENGMSELVEENSTYNNTNEMIQEKNGKAQEKIGEEYKE